MSATVTRVIPMEAKYRRRLQLTDSEDSLLGGHQSGQTEALIGAPGEKRILIVYQVAKGIRLSMSLGRYR